MSRYSRDSSRAPHDDWSHEDQWISDEDAWRDDTPTARTALARGDSNRYPIPGRGRQRRPLPSVTDDGRAIQTTRWKRVRARLARRPVLSVIMAVEALLVVGAIAIWPGRAFFATHRVGSPIGAFGGGIVSSWSTQAAGITAYDHIVVIVMENHAYGEIVGNRAAPYINGTLLPHGAVAGNYSAVAHPSLPNYVALTGGSTFGETTDCGPASCPVHAAHLGDSLEHAGKSWKAYLESMPGSCAAADAYPYAVKHNPWVYYTDLGGNSSRCGAHDVPYAQLRTDLQRMSTTPNFVWITPNVVDDMHDGTISQGDTWLSQQVPMILASPAFTQQHSLLVVTWDEGDGAANQQVATIFDGYSVPAGFTSNVSYTHYSLLHTIEHALGVPTMTGNDAGAAMMTDMISLGGNPTPTVPAKPPDTSTSTPSSAPMGNLFWHADFETGNLSPFRSVHTGMPSWGNSSATVVRQGATIAGLNNDGPWTAPAPHNGTYCAGLLVDGPASDVGSGGGQRAELTSGYYDTVNTERWYGLSVYIPSNPNRNSSGGATMYNNALWQTGWGTSLNLKTSSYNSATGDNNSFQIANDANPQNGWKAAWYHISPIVYDQWVNFTIHVYWATDSAGYFEVYENGQLMTLTGLSDPNFHGTHVTGPDYGVASQMVSEYDWYRSTAVDYPNLLYLDDLKIGDTYSIVQPG